MNGNDYATSVVNSLFTTIEVRANAQELVLDCSFPSTASAAQKPLPGYGAANLETIKEAAKKYDSYGYMQTLQNNGYLTSNES